MPDVETQEQILEVKEFFSYEDLSMVFLGGSYDKRRIKKVSFLKKDGKAFISKAAMAYEFIFFCKNNKIKITEFVDKREKFEHQAKEFSDEEIGQLFPFDYNEHQIRALKKILKANTGIIKATTSAGKCCTGDVKINIENIGDIKIENLFDGFGEEEIRACYGGVRVLTEDGYKEVEALYKTNKRDVIEVELEDGSKIKGVPDHRIKTKDGWKKIKDLEGSEEIEFYEEKKYRNFKEERIFRKFIFWVWYTFRKIVSYYKR